jgi:hypothetical protein
MAVDTKAWQLANPEKCAAYAEKAAAKARRELGTIAERPNDGRSPVANWGDPRLPEYIWARIVPEPTSGCWLWMGGVCPAGYGQINRQKPRLHRITYQSLIGLIPEGLHIDHKCRVRCCCNPMHLEPVTPHENVLRGEAGLISGAQISARTHCPRGHEYAGDNLSFGRLNGGRICKACRRMYTKLYKAGGRVRKKTGAA